MDHVKRFLEETAAVAAAVDRNQVRKMVEALSACKQRPGRVFLLGVGGSASAASHLVNDLRKLCGIEAYAPTDNVSELTARTNDDGWETVFADWLAGSRLSESDAVMIFSVGGGSRERSLSVNLIRAMEYARSVEAPVLAIVGRDGGAAAGLADVCVIIPPLFPERVTPHTESFHAVISHLLVSHPHLQDVPASWEGRE